MDDTLTIDIESSNNASGGIDSLIQKLEALKLRVNENLKAIGRLNSALISLGSTAKNFSFTNITTPNVPTANANMGAESTPNMMNIDMSELVEGQKEAQTAIRGTGEEANTAGRQIDKLGNKGKKAGDDIASGAENGKNKLRDVDNQARHTSSGLSKLGNIVKNISFAPFSIFFSTLKRGKSSINDIGSSFDSLTKKLRMTTLALLGARGAFTAIRKAVNAYMQYDTALAQSLQSNWAILGSLLAPIIENLISLFAKLISYIATVVKLLTGVDLVARANAKALNSQASGAKNASKAVKDLADQLGNLQKFDDLNVVDFPKDSSSGASGGGAGSGLPTLAIEDVDLSALETFIDKIKANDWYGLGMEISRAFNEGLRLIDFEWLEEKARQWGKNMGDLFNGLTDGMDWTLLGQKIAGGLNTAMGFVNTFFDTYNFNHLGEGLANGVNGIVDTVHWADVGQMLVNGFQAMLVIVDSFVSTLDFTSLGNGIGQAFESAMLHVDFGRGYAILGKGITGIASAISGFINSVDWSRVAKDLSTKLTNGLQEGAKALQEFDWMQFGQDFVTNLEDFFANIDWESVSESLAGFLGSAIGAIGGLIVGALGQLASDIVTGIHNYIGEQIETAGFDNDGVNIIVGIFKGIIGLKEGIKKWVKEHIFDPFISGFKKAFGIDDAESELKKLGKQLVENFYDGVKDIWSRVKSTFEDLKDKIKDKFKDIKDDVKDKVDNAVSWTKDKFSWSNLKDTFETAKTNIANKFKDIKDSVASNSEKAVDKLKETFKWDNIKDNFIKIKDSIKEKFEEIGTTVGTALSSKFNEMVSKIVTKAIDMINGFVRALNKVIDILNEIPKVNLKRLQELEYPKLATGTNNIEVEGLYHLHQGEAVVPKKYNPAINNKAYSENNAQMLSRMDKLLDLLNNMETTNNIYIGNEKVHDSTVRYINRQREIYGTDVV